MTCAFCKAKAGKVAFECIGCCVRWLSQMNKAEMVLNAPVIESIMGAAFMEKVRQAYRVRK